MRIKGIRAWKKLVAGSRIREEISARRRTIIISGATWRYISKKTTLKSVSQTRFRLWQSRTKRRLRQWALLPHIKSFQIQSTELNLKLLTLLAPTLGSDFDTIALSLHLLILIWLETQLRSKTTIGNINLLITTNKGILKCTTCAKLCLGSIEIVRNKQGLEQLLSETSYNYTHALLTKNSKISRKISAKWRLIFEVKRERMLMKVHWNQKGNLGHLLQLMKKKMTSSLIRQFQAISHPLVSLIHRKTAHTSKVVKLKFRN